MRKEEEVFLQQQELGRVDYAPHHPAAPFRFEGRQQICTASPPPKGKKKEIKPRGWETDLFTEEISP